MASPISVRKSIQEACSAENEQNEEAKRGIFTANMLDSYLYSKKPILAVDMRRMQANKQDENRNMAARLGRNNNKDDSGFLKVGRNEETPLQSLHQLVHTKEQRQPVKVLDTSLDQPKCTGASQPTYAVTSFPAEVQLCTSSIPGAKYGVCTNKDLPAGTWIGPYEGRRTADQRQVNVKENNEYLWEIYEKGTVSHFLDGSDENCSSWMRFIRCARDKKEQNMAAYQYGQNIYYRTLRDISCGDELLVWYSDSYIKHLEIPLSLIETETPFEPAEILDCTKSAEVTSNVESYSHTMPSAPPFSQQVPELQEQEPDVDKSKVWNITSREIYIPNNAAQEHKPFSMKEFPSDAPCGKLNVNYSAETDSRKCYLGDSRGQTGTAEEGNGIKESLLNTLCSPFQCKQCLKVFTQRIQLQMHVCPKAPYKPFQCGHCSMSFAHPLELRNHVVIHTNERPFKCGFCGRSFAGATTLNNHVRTHTGERPFICNNCGKTFSIATQLSRHTKTPGECILYNK